MINRNDMSEVFKIGIDLAISLITEGVSNTVKKYMGEETVSERIEHCFMKAVSKWSVSEETKNIIHYDKIKHYRDLREYLTDSKHGIHPKTKELLRLWVDEMCNDEICSNFIIMHKQEIADCKLDSIYSTLRDELCSKVDTLLEGQDQIKKLLYEISQQTVEDKKKYIPKLMSLLKGVIASMIEEMKMDSASRLINDLEIQFKDIINESQELRAEISYRKGLSLFYRDAHTAYSFLQNAFQINPTEKEYIEWEIRRLVSLNKSQEASILTKNLPSESMWKYLIEVIFADNKMLEYRRTPETLRNSYIFRIILFDALLIDENVDLSFLFEDNNITIPSSFSFSNLNEWLYIITYYRFHIGNHIPLSFENPILNKLEQPKNVINEFEFNLSKTELRDCFGIIKRLYCFWNFLCDRNTKWVDEYLAMDDQSLGEQKKYFLLVKTSMLLLAGRHEEAFASLVNISEDMDDDVLRFAIMMSIQTNTVLHLRWALDKAVTQKMKVASQEAVLIAHSINQERFKETLSSIANVEFQNNTDKIVLQQLCNYYGHIKMDVSVLKDSTDSLCEEMKAYAALILAEEGNTYLAFEMLRPIVNEDVVDVKQRVFLSVLSRMQEKTPDLYRILVKNRKAGNECDDQLLQIEYKLDCRVADYKNALETISELHRRHSDNVSIFANYLYTLGRVCPEELKRFEDKAKCMYYSNCEDVKLAYQAFAENGYLETATEILYYNAKSSDDFELRNFYHYEASLGLIASFASKEYDIAKEGLYALCDKDGERIFYRASMHEGEIGKKMMNAKKDDVIEIEIGNEASKLIVVGIYNKYYKLTGDIIREAMNGSNPELRFFKIDMNNPVESLNAALQKMSQGQESPIEREKKAYEQYEMGELALMQLVDNSNMLSSYYKLLFSPFKVHCSNSTIEIQKINLCNLDTSNATFILDLPTIITFAEFSVTTKNEISGNMAITTIVHEYIKSVYKSAVRYINADMYEAIRSGNIIQFSQYADTDAKEHIKNLLGWIDNHCKDVIADQVLAIMDNGNRTPLKDMLFSSLSMLMKPNCFFVTDDIKLMKMLPGISIISTETFVKLFSNSKTSEAYSEFLFNCSFRGVDMSDIYIINEYQKMKRMEDNKIVDIMQNLQENPFLFDKVVSAALKLASSEVDINTLRVTFTNMFTMAFKAYSRDDVRNLINIANDYFQVPYFSCQFVRECIIDAGQIINNQVK